MMLHDKFEAWIRDRSRGCLEPSEIDALCQGELDIDSGEYTFTDTTVQAQWEAWQEATRAMDLIQIGKPLPLVVGIECYEFFGKWVKIVEVNMFDEPYNAEVVVESRTMERKQVEFGELSWRANYRLAQRMY